MKDKCVICNKVTEHDKSTHISCRQYYVEGTGQLCKECFVMFYMR